MTNQPVTPDPIPDRTVDAPYGPEGYSGDATEAAVTDTDGDAEEDRAAGKAGYSIADIRANKDVLVTRPEGTAPAKLWEMWDHRPASTGDELIGTWNDINTSVGGTARMPLVGRP